MKIRRGFVTNSSSTNDIFVALGTAGAAAALGTIINVVQVSEYIELVSYALLETTHLPEEPRPPVIRVNDSEYTVWFYAAVRIIDVQTETNEKTGETTIEVLRDEYDDTYTSNIKIDISQEFCNHWLTFGTSGSGEGSDSYTTLSGGYKVCGFMCESSENDRPRSHRSTPPSQLAFNISVDVSGKVLGKRKECTIRDEAALGSGSGYALNDSSVITKLPFMLTNKDKYSWKLDFEIGNGEIENHCSIELKKSKEVPTYDAIMYELLIRPNGKELFTKGKSVNSISSRIDFTGKPSSSHIEDVWSYGDITLIDEGLFFEGEKDQEGNLGVNAYLHETEEDENPEKEIPPTPFKLSCVVKLEDSDTDNTAKFIDMFEAEIAFKDLKGTDDATSNLVQAFKYELKPEGSTGNYVFIPKMQLPTSKAPYHVLLPVSCEFEGEMYDLDLPINLIGEPYGKKAEWEKEYKNLRIIIRKYIPAEQWIDILDQVNNSKERLSVEQLRLMRRSIYETARDRLVAEAQGYESIATICDWTAWGLEGVKWVGDQAFSYLMAVYTGPIGEAFIVPFKDVLTMVVADELTECFWGGNGAYSEDELARGSLSGIFSSFENALMDGADGMVGAESLSIKQLGRYLAAFATIKCLNHYFCDVKPDGSPVGFWDAIVDTCKDLTTNIFKLLVAKKFDSLIKSPKAKEIFEKYIGKQFKDFLISKVPDWEKHGMKAVEKYLTEFGGLIYSSAYGKTVEVAGSLAILEDPNDIIVTLNLSSDPKNPWIVKISLNQAKESLYNYMFDIMFGGFTFATAPITPTDDPIYYKK